MSQPLTSTPKGKPQPFRIVFGRGGGPAQDNIVRKVVKRTKKSSLSDIEAAVNSISEEVAQDHVSLNRPITKVSPKFLTIPQEGGGNKVEKIVFLPKLLQKKVTLLKDPVQVSPSKTVIRNQIGLNTVKPRSIIVGQGGSALKDIVAAVNDKVNSFPRKRKLGDIALASWQKVRKLDASELPTPPPPPTPTPIAPSETALLCRLCGNAIQDQVIELFNEETGAATTTGAKLKTITGCEMVDPGNAPTSCCKACSLKVQVCFCLLVELQAADEVARDTFADDSGGMNLGARIFTCKTCDQEVMGKQDFIRHHETHVQQRTIGSTSGLSETNENEVTAPIEGADILLETARNLLETDLKDDGQPIFQKESGEYVCELCGRCFTHKFLLLLHRKAPKTSGEEETQTPSTNNCFVCGLPKSGLSQSADGRCSNCVEEEDGNLIDFGVEWDGTQDNNSQSNYTRCPVCEIDVKSSNYAVHLRKHVKRFYCDICGKGFTYKCTLKSHLAKVHDQEKPYTYVGLTDTCVKCGLKCSDENDLRLHMISVHGSFNTALLSCSFCSKTYPDLFKLRMHFKLMHNFELPQNSRSTGDIHYVVCHVCGMVLHSIHATKIHMKEVHGLTTNNIDAFKQQCELCGKEFSVKQNLIHHINSAHLNVKPMPCDLCGARFAKHSSLIFHRFRHTGEKPFKCAVCEKFYRQRNDVIRHLARHVRDQEVAYEDAHAINVSTSKYITKRNIFLKDSTIKGLLDMTMTPVSKRRARKPKKKSVLYFEGEDDGVYEEVIEDDAAQTSTSDHVQFVIGDGSLNGNIQYIVQDGDFVEGEGTEYGQLPQFVDENGKQVNIQYVMEEDMEATESDPLFVGPEVKQELDDSF